MVMMKKGSTSQMVVLRAIDSSDGTPETGIAFDTTGIDLWYRRENALKVSITEADLSTPDLEDTWETGGVLHIGDGYFRLDVPDLALASAAGVDNVLFGGTATGMIIIGVWVTLSDFDPQDVLRAGLTALPAAAADAAGGLVISDDGGFDIDEVVLSGPTKAEMDTAHGLLATPAEVATEMADALRADALTATPQGAPATTPTFMEALMVIYDALVHKIDVDDSFKEFYNNAGTLLWKKALSDDGSNYVEDESETGA